ncbi:hypothetical protein HD806DRAFT_529027 [Xylariaceae sp. AK1471]|nr:hypothetical protein HD806DRAFT_529027 [Xylariaceae sp. AK1471]
MNTYISVLNIAVDDNDWLEQSFAEGDTIDVNHAMRDGCEVEWNAQLKQWISSTIDEELLTLDGGSCRWLELDAMALPHFKTKIPDSVREMDFIALSLKASAVIGGRRREALKTSPLHYLLKLRKLRNWELRIRVYANHHPIPNSLQAWTRWFRQALPLPIHGQLQQIIWAYRLRRCSSWTLTRDDEYEVNFNGQTTVDLPRACDTTKLREACKGDILLDILDRPVGEVLDLKIRFSSVLRPLQCFSPSSSQSPMRFRAKAKDYRRCSENAEGC